MTADNTNTAQPALEIVERQTLDLSSQESRDATVNEMANMISMVEDAKTRILQPSIHYGFIPGTQRPSLWQPGAEILCQMFQWQTQMDRTSEYENWENGIFSYTYKCTLSSRHGDLITEREATCSTQEPNYQRQIDRGSPAAQFRETVMLMAEKRAYVAAVRAAGACSAIFTQDDDIVPEQKPSAVTNTGMKPQPSGRRPLKVAGTVTPDTGTTQFLFPSGKHAGKTLGNTPEDYLDWILTKESDPTFRYPEWITAVKAYRN